MRKGMLFCAAVILTVIAGCSTNEDREAGYGEETKNGTTLISNKPGRAVNDNNDAVEQPSDQLLNTPGSNSNVTPNTGSEVQKARQIIEANTEYEAGGVWQKGNSLSVTIHDNGKIDSDEQRKQERKRIKRMLTEALPRYNIEVNMEPAGED
ncbi:hypothetical protein ELQ35_03990 [Peribacillus cavernae]|uniref:Sporulation protein n=1 Tax=Peribacillus cavernae TaxID=1674310 RepID=A0A433HTG5_9BACI|nr:hypothetical protein [Peribacillus cavernae]MDQ0218524.1 hypothetical protein [Peribacillus cavernae]RUQ31515.1 hypothetical protein ELQ35_03990 [Peribacillus cavernae]